MNTSHLAYRNEPSLLSLCIRLTVHRPNPMKWLKFRKTNCKDGELTRFSLRKENWKNWRNLESIFVWLLFCIIVWFLCFCNMWIYFPRTKECFRKKFGHVTKIVPKIFSFHLILYINSFSILKNCFCICTNFESRIKYKF